METAEMAGVLHWATDARPAVLEQAAQLSPVVLLLEIPGAWDLAELEQVVPEVEVVAIMGEAVENQD